MGAVLALSPSSGCENEVDDALGKVDDALTEWLLHLPSSDSESIGDSGEFDEMLFQAQMIVYS
jgi:hypothetical protein